MPSTVLPQIFPTDIAVKCSQSALMEQENESALHDDSFVEEWIYNSRLNASQKTSIIPLNNVVGWEIEKKTGNIHHKSGRFFSVIGIHCRHRVYREEIEWDQPVIEQPETGILGILARNINGTLHFCLQAKEEPGNLDSVQLSPTVQATYSNYTCAHGGAVPQFLEHFIEPAHERIIFARLQSEDGGRFLYKSNRNMIVKADDDFPLELPDNFIWLTLGQIAGLIHKGNIINACARSILSSLVNVSPKWEHHRVMDEYGIRSVLQWFDDRRAANHMVARRIGLNQLREWHIDGKGFFSHLENRFFRVIGLDVVAGTREIKSWSQPIIENPAAGVVGLLVRKGESGLELLMQAKAEAGNRNTVQIAPTVQFTQGNYEGSRKLKKPFLFHDFIEPDHFPVIHESRQTEEGARFYREYHLHRILMLPEGTELTVPPDFHWLTLKQVMFMLHFGEQVNSCARSILSCLL